MTTNETLHSVTRDPAEFIDSDVLREIVSTIAEALPDPQDDASCLPARLTDAETSSSEADKGDAVRNIRLAAALHRFVYSRSEYGENPEGGLNRSPTETLEEGGNCADQSLLLYGLYREAGIEARITSAQQHDGGNSHAFVECGFKTGPDVVIDILMNYYRQTEVLSSGRFHFFQADGLSYLIADPISARFLGDRGGLNRMGYVHPDGSMEINRRFSLYN